MTARAVQPKLVSRDTIGIAHLLLSGTGVVLLPTTARLAYASGSDVLTVAFTRGVFASLLLTIVARLAGQTLRLPRDLYLHSRIVGIAGARILGATRAATLTLIGPPLAALFTWLIFGETVTLTQWFGFAVVLAALFMFEKLARGGR